MKWRYLSVRNWLIGQSFGNWRGKWLFFFMTENPFASYENNLSSIFTKRSKKSQLFSLLHPRSFLLWTMGLIGPIEEQDRDKAITKSNKTKCKNVQDGQWFIPSSSGNRYKGRRGGDRSQRCYFCGIMWGCEVVSRLIRLEMKLNHPTITSQSTYRR